MPWIQQKFIAVTFALAVLGYHCPTWHSCIPKYLCKPFVLYAGTCHILRTWSPLRL